MAKRTNASRIVLDWRRLLGFDQATGADDAASAVTLNPKIGPKEARGFSDSCTLGAKIGPKTARGFGRSAAPLGGKAGAKVGSKDPVVAGSVSLGRNLNATVGQKDPDVVPSALTAKIGFKTT